MFTRKVLYTVSLMVTFGMLATTSTGAVFNYKRTTYFTFNNPVALPGVTLPAGTYTFELPDPDHAWSIVRVSSPNGRHIYYTAFTTVIERPKGLAFDPTVVFGERPANAASPVKAWFPQDERSGRQFIY